MHGHALARLPRPRSTLRRDRRRPALPTRPRQPDCANLRARAARRAISGRNGHGRVSARPFAPGDPAPALGRLAQAWPVGGRPGHRIVCRSRGPGNPGFPGPQTRGRDRGGRRPAHPAPRPGAPRGRVWEGHALQETTRFLPRCCAAQPHGRLT